MAEIAVDFVAKALGDTVAQMDARSSLSLLVSVEEVGNSYFLGLAVAFANRQPIQLKLNLLGKTKTAGLDSGLELGDMKW